METNRFWGYHLVLDAAGCDQKAISDKDIIYKFTKELVEEIKMVAYGEPQIVRFGQGDMVGYTLMQLIETSNINCHFVDVPKTAYLDVFSCKQYDINTVLRVFKKYFKPTTVRYNFLVRHAQEI